MTLGKSVLCTSLHRKQPIYPFSDQQISLSVSKDIKQQIDNIIEIKNLKEAELTLNN